MSPLIIPNTVWHAGKKAEFTSGAWNPSPKMIPWSQIPVHPLAHHTMQCWITHGYSPTRKSKYCFFSRASTSFSYSQTSREIIIIMIKKRKENSCQCLFGNIYGLPKRGSSNSGQIRNNMIALKQFPSNRILILSIIGTNFEYRTSIKV